MGNTEGSRVISRTYRVRKNLILRLSKNQLHIVLGSILGDAYVYPQGKICIEHNWKQKGYVRWKHNQLASIAYKKVSRVQRLDSRTGKTSVSYRFFLRQYFRPLRILFYKNKKKVVPGGLADYFDPLTLAVWYMDDGYLDKNRSPLLMTECYSVTDVSRLVQTLYWSLGIKAYVTNKGRVRVNPKSRDKFFRLVEPWIYPSLRYKLP